jgi:hypothetical protein
VPGKSGALTNMQRVSARRHNQFSRTYCAMVVGLN